MTTNVIDGFQKFLPTNNYFRDIRVQCEIKSQLYETLPPSAKVKLQHLVHVHDFSTGMTFANPSNSTKMKQYKFDGNWNSFLDLCQLIHSFQLHINHFVVQNNEMDNGDARMAFDDLIDVNKQHDMVVHNPVKPEYEKEKEMIQISSIKSNKSKKSNKKKKIRMKKSKKYITDIACTDESSTEEIDDDKDNSEDNSNVNDSNLSSSDDSEDKTEDSSRNGKYKEKKTERSNLHQKSSKKQRRSKKKSHHHSPSHQKENNRTKEINRTKSPNRKTYYSSSKDRASPPPIPDRYPQNNHSRRHNSANSRKFSNRSIPDKPLDNLPSESLLDEDQGVNERKLYVKRSSFEYVRRIKRSQLEYISNKYAVILEKKEISVDEDFIILEIKRFHQTSNLSGAVKALEYLMDIINREVVAIKLPSAKFYTKNKVNQIESEFGIVTLKQQKKIVGPKSQVDDFLNQENMPNVK
ncbi:hypothetical protein SNEBB_006918 [Seison nebaliae]|nr:hypothetical protein SNEBB_006918 [Seison nebaliae]